LSSIFFTSDPLDVAVSEALTVLLPGCQVKVSIELGGSEDEK